MGVRHRIFATHNVRGAWNERLGLPASKSWRAADAAALLFNCEATSVRRRDLCDHGEGIRRAAAWAARQVLCAGRQGSESEDGFVCAMRLGRFFVFRTG